MVAKEGQCCGECIQTKCRADGELYNVGNMWKSKDGCTFSECVQKGDSVSISSYKKTCPELKNCPKEKTYIKDCCSYCKTGKQLDDGMNRFTFQYSFLILSPYYRRNKS